MRQRSSFRQSKANGRSQLNTTPLFAIRSIAACAMLLRRLFPLLYEILGPQALFNQATSCIGLLTKPRKADVN
jgi:hypothetical protein